MYADKPLLHKKNSAHKRGQLRTIALDVTHKCNMKCPHCYAETFVDSDLVDIETLKHAIDEAYELGVFHYVMQGGEAILAPKRLEQIISLCYPDETYITVVSNAWAMTRECIKWLKDIKVDKIGYSLDSGIPEEHDTGRMPGSFERVIEAVKMTMDEGLFSSLSTVITRGSVRKEGFQKILEVANDLGVRVDVQIAEPVGKWDGMKDVLITPEDAALVRKIYIEFLSYHHKYLMSN